MCFPPTMFFTCPFFCFLFASSTTSTNTELETYLQPTPSGEQIGRSSVLWLFQKQQTGGNTNRPFSRRWHSAQKQVFLFRFFLNVHGTCYMTDCIPPPTTAPSPATRANAPTLFCTPCVAAAGSCLPPKRRRKNPLL